LVRSGGDMQLLYGKGMALGVLPEVSIEERAVDLNPGDSLILYTDGVTEALNEDMDEFGLERLRYAAYNSRGLDADELKEAVITAVRDHTGDTAQFDDVTLVVLKRPPANNTTMELP
ncbi:MAG: SpoIIE family protein phosphatase, partial [Candidatus Promineifilaceae bacterium]|nr:SpoIIE family protein phosphatase [Candidatus Promineifilaceae bacterium]